MKIRFEVGDRLVAAYERPDGTLKPRIIRIKDRPQIVDTANYRTVVMICRVTAKGADLQVCYIRQDHTEKCFG